MKTRDLTLAAIFAAVTVVFAQITIPLPFTPIPFTLSIAAVYLTGAILPKRYAVYSQLIYILLGVIGLPVFGNFSGGIGRILGPTGGYILSYPLMAFATAWIIERFGKKNVLTCALGMLSALGICYLFGSLWYVAVGHVSWLQSITMTVLPFLVLDLVKVVIFALFAVALNRALLKSKLITI